MVLDPPKLGGSVLVLAIELTSEPPKDPPSVYDEFRCKLGRITGNNGPTRKTRRISYAKVNQVQVPEDEFLPGQLKGTMSQEQVNTALAAITDFERKKVKYHELLSTYQPCDLSDDEKEFMKRYKPIFK